MEPTGEKEKLVARCVEVFVVVVDDTSLPW
jgi:hypothetical protein